MFMNLRKHIREILEETYSKSKLPKKPDHHLFSDKWLSKLDTDGEYVTLYHFGPPNLKVLDPKFFGQHRYTDSESWWGKNRVFFYTNLKQKERIVSGELYKAKIKLSDLYPFNEDPLNLYDFAAKEYGNPDVPTRIQVIYMTDYLEKMGYKGMIYRWVGKDLIAVIWEKVRNLETSQTQEKLELPISDLRGFPIKKGLSTNPNLSFEEKKEEVVRTMISSDYPKKFIKDYLNSFK